VTKERWLAERRADPWLRMAKAEGYPSRAAYKLKHIQRLYKLIHQGDFVVELGAAPGGMLRVASEIVGGSGLAVGVDIKPIKCSAPNIRALRLDINDPSAPVEILSALGGRRCDALISDASPGLTGIPEVDTLRQLDLLIRCFEIADAVLRDGGNVMFKAFECRELSHIERPIRQSFKFYKRATTPPSLRKHSSEVYLVGLGRRRAPMAHLLKEALT